MNSGKWNLNLNDVKYWLRKTANYIAPSVLVAITTYQMTQNWDYAVGAFSTSFLQSAYKLIKVWSDDSSG